MKVNRLLAIFLIIGIVFSSIFVFQRANIENGYKNVEMTLDYDEILKMSQESHKDVGYFLKEFKSMKVNSVSLNEITLNSLKDRESLNVRTSLDGYDLIVQSDDKIFNFIVDGFSKKLNKNKIHIVGKNTLRIDGSKDDYIYDETVVKDITGKFVGKRKIGEGSKLEYLGLGFLQSDIDLIKKCKMDIIPRPIYISQYDNKNTITNYFNFLDKENIDPNYIIFAGSEVLGGGKYNKYLKDELSKRNIMVSMIETGVQRENISQKGLENLVEIYNYNSTRAFNIWDWIQERYDYEMPMHRHGEEVMNSIYRAVTERNIRVIYFRPFIDKQDNYVTDMSIYKQRFNELEKRMYDGHHLKIGKVNAMKTFHQNRFMDIPIAIGIIASFLMLFENIFMIRDKYIKMLLGLGIVGVSLIYGLNIKLDLMNKMFALLGSITMPSLAMVYILNKVREILTIKENTKISKIISKSIVILLIGAVISFVGVLFETSLLADSKYFLEMDIFKGVKLSQIAPIMVSLLVYISLFGYKRKENKKGIYLDELMNLFKEDIKVGHVIILGIIGVAGIIFIARTGHETNIKPSTIELLFRNILELVLTARPRTKAFLIAYPALMLMVYFACRNKKWAILPLSIAVAIGEGNIVNTFSHLRAPLYLSLIRTNYEILFGIIVGSLVLLIVNFIWSRLEGRKRNA